MVVEEEIITGNNRVFLDNGSVINRYSHVLSGAVIGENVMIGQGCYVGSKVVIGDNTRIQNDVSLYDGLTLGKNVFVGPKVIFTNHHNPAIRDNFVYDLTYIGDNSTLCAGCIIIAPVIVTGKHVFTKRKTII